MGEGFVALMFLLVSLTIVLEGFVWVEARTALKPSSSTNFTIENKCDYPVWPVINGTSTEFSISTTCFVLKKGEARLISVCPSTTIPTRQEKSSWKSKLIPGTISMNLNLSSFNFADHYCDGDYVESKEDEKE
ncbi:hypothetical protein IGI04_027265 [Brassica rapa subsp. trilocularis]|uniref:Uncharacterized protein n=1 Tax=Brassica rapa subsp. trilocularis TaxID=1813537 RepID=A0ABQ7L271_BRACM|nr:hypothetical protein IGI04_027265 [Brassica rapa subsp. trilocularis]